MDSSKLSITPDFGSCLNTPRPYELLYSICSNCMRIEDCFYELIDNSIDAGANQIKIQYKIESNDLITLQFIDNGRGMNLDQLAEAMVLGSRVTRNKGSLGHFGVGLIVSAFNLGRELKVLSRCQDGEAIFSSMSLKEMKSSDKWTKDYGLVKDLDYFNSLVPDSGTIVEIRLNREMPNNLISVIKKLPQEIARKYNKLLDGNLNIIIIEDKTVVINQGIDPFCQGKSKVLFNEIITLPVNIPGEKKKEVPIEVKGYLLPENNDSQVPTTLTNQGIYVYRNNREITRGGFMGVTGLHNTLNRFRVELNIDEEGQEAIKISSNKTNAAFANLDALGVFKSYLAPYIEAVEKEVTSIQKVVKSTRKTQEIERKIREVFREATLDLIEVESIKNKSGSAEKGKSSSCSKKGKRYPSGKGFIIKFNSIEDTSNIDTPHSFSLKENVLTIVLNESNRVVQHYLSSPQLEESYKKSILLDIIAFYSNDSLDYANFIESKNTIESKII